MTAVESLDEGALVVLASGKRIAAESVLYSAGRQGARDALELQNAGLEADQRGRISVDDNYRTKVEHIHAVGDVTGFPSLAATAMEQGASRRWTPWGRSTGRGLSCCPSVSTRSPRSASWGRPRRSSPMPAFPTRSAWRATANWLAGPSSASRTAC